MTTRAWASRTRPWTRHSCRARSHACCSTHNGCWSGIDGSLVLPVCLLGGLLTPGSLTYYLSVCLSQVGTLPLASASSAAALQHAVERAVGEGVAVALDVNWRPTFWCGTAHPCEGPGQEAMDRIRPVLQQVGGRQALLGGGWLPSSSSSSHSHQCRACLYSPRPP